MSTKLKLYKYKALNANGIMFRGVQHSYSEKTLFENLKKIRCELLSCTEVVSRRGLLGFRANLRVSLRDKIQFYRSMEQMLKSGISVLTAMENCVMLAGSSGMRDTVASMSSYVNEGMMLHEAMAKHPEIFSNIEISIIGAKQESGDFSEGFQYLAEYLIRKDALYRRIRKATRYPMILFIVISLAILIMLGYVTPKIIDFLVVAQGETNLPFATVSLMVVSGFFQKFWLWIIAIVAVGSGVFYNIYNSSYAFKERVDTYLLGMPVVGELILKLEISRFTTTLISLYASRIDILKSITLSQEVVSNTAVKKALDIVHQELTLGRSMKVAFERSGQFPIIVVQMMGIAEETGRIGEIMDQIVDFYQKDIDETIDRIVTAIEPALTIIFAAIILWIAAAVFGPIYSMFETLEF